MNRNVTMAANGMPKLTRREYGGEENVLCMEITAVGGMGGGVQVFVPVADESDALEWKRKIEREDQIGAANLLKAMMAWEERDRLEATEAQVEVAQQPPVHTAADRGSALEQALPAAMSIEEIKASLTPEEIASTEARIAAATAKVRHEEIQATWKQASERIAAERSGKSPLSSSWARAIEKVTAHQNNTIRRNQ